MGGGERENGVRGWDLRTEWEETEAGTKRDRQRDQERQNKRERNKDPNSDRRE